MVDVGQPAPDFTTQDHNQQTITLSQYRGEKHVVLSCYPFAFTSG